MKHQAAPTANDYSKLVPAVEQAIKIISHMSSLPGVQASLTDIAVNVDISKSKASAILNTLIRYGVVTRDPESKTYSLGPALIAIGQKVTEQFNYAELAKPLLKELAVETDSTAIIGIITGEDQYSIIHQESNWQISMLMLTQPNKVHPLTYGAHGKVIVAFLDEKQRNEILAGDALYFHKDPSRLDRKRLARELEACRTEGYARDHETGHPMVNILSAPFFGAHGRPMGAIEIIGLMEEEDIPEKGKRVVEMAGRFTRLISNTKEER